MTRKRWTTLVDDQETMDDPERTLN